MLDRQTDSADRDAGSWLVTGMEGLPGHIVGLLAHVQADKLDLKEEKT